MVKIAVLAPMPRARVRTATVVKPGGFAQHAGPVAKVLSEVLNPSHVARIATLFFAFFYSADFKESLPTRLFDGETFADVLLSS
jgi:hypothetical protein